MVSIALLTTASTMQKNALAMIVATDVIFVASGAMIRPLLLEFNDVTSRMAWNRMAHVPQSAAGTNNVRPEPGRIASIMSCVASEKTSALNEATNVAAQRLIANVLLLLKVLHVSGTSLATLTMVSRWYQSLRDRTRSD